ncbi:substrate-binding domain-containing protein [Aneurinibacillus sp. Ricciae_BoGa-3]|uniref:substrate-binding domain-containing protein n=1 Tax=Aneurinibacillus sp. Ricciae_BoGa-3 TaxID=3022697 RepID=UPI002340E620|nr:substrate-binding domain-containing protein [Aneurinibacillus sp. Ricciae_BoGa-3]WCK53191.1 substrate-binding domain-containing protein [Aneurinibacillus sp. Ricciae_BoGa-3]
MKKNNGIKKAGALAATALLSVSLFGCGTQANQTSGSGSGSSKNVAQPSWYQEPSADQLKQAQQDTITGVILSSGPNGEKAFPADKIKITDQQLAKIKAGHYTAAISLHYSGSDWSQKQIDGLKSEFEKMGISIIAVTDANFKNTQQASDLEAISAKKPNILVSIPVDAKTEASAYKKLSDAGVKIVFMDQPAVGMKAGKDYVSVVSADNFGNGMVAADELAKAINNKGNVAVLYYASNFYVTNQRYEGFAARLKAKYPDIHIVATEGFQDQNQTQTQASALLTKQPNLQGLWVAWDTPTMGAVSAARIAGKNPNDFKIVTEDLGHEVALNMAQNGFVKGLGAQRPFDQGVAEAREAALALIGGETHPYVAVPSVAVNRSNLPQSYQTVYHAAPPADVTNALK